MGKITDQIAEFHNSGSEDAFSVLVHEFKAQVRALIVGKIGTGLVGNSTASDFVQETFAQAHTTLYEKRVEYLGMDSAWFLSFLAQIAHHKIGNELGRLDTGKRDSTKEERIDNDEKQILDNRYSRSIGSVYWFGCLVDATQVSQNRRASRPAAPNTSLM